MGMSMTPATAAVMRSVPVAKAGVGSAVLSSMRQVGGSLGIAVMGTIVASGTASSLRHGDPPQIAYLHCFHHALSVARATRAHRRHRRAGHPPQQPCATHPRPVTKPFHKALCGSLNAADRLTPVPNPSGGNPNRQ